MAESRGLPLRRDYKEIVSAVRVISDPVKPRGYSGISIVRDGSIVAIDSTNLEMCTFNKNGKLLSTFDICRPNCISDVAELSDGNLVMCDDVLKVYSRKGRCLQEFGKECAGDDPNGIAVTEEGNIIVCCYGEPRILLFNQNKELIKEYDLVQCEEHSLDSLLLCCLDGKGNAYFCEDTHRVFKFDKDGQYLRHFGDSILNYPCGIAATSDDHIIVVSYEVPKLYVFTAEGEFVHEINDDRLKDSAGVAIDKDDWIYVTCGAKILVF